MSDPLQRHLCELPAFRALLRAVEARFYRDLPMPEPVLDLGCGDGHFASVAFDRPLAAGFDPAWASLQEARLRGAHRILAMAEGGRMPFSDGTFGTVVSNSVLEHIPDLPPVLAETARVLQPGGRFYFSVPGPNFLPFLSIGRALDRIGFRSLGSVYRRFFNGISRHYHCDGVATWRDRLTRAGLNLECSWCYFSRKALGALEWGHYLGLPSLVCKKLTGHWILWPSQANLWLTERLVRPFYEEQLSQPPQACDQTEVASDREGAYLFFAARRVGVPRVAV
jgi:SAM-dependent methyltransferase